MEQMIEKLEEKRKELIAKLKEVKSFEELNGLLDEISLNVNETTRLIKLSYKGEE